MKIPTPVITAITLCTFYSQFFCMEITSIKERMHTHPIPSLINLCVKQLIEMIINKNPLLHDNPGNRTLKEIDINLQTKISRYMLDIKEYGKDSTLYSDKNTLITKIDNCIISFNKNNNTRNYSCFIPKEQVTPHDIYVYKSLLNVVVWSDWNENLNLINAKGEIETPESTRKKIHRVRESSNLSNYIEVSLVNGRYSLLNLTNNSFVNPINNDHISYDSKWIICAMQNNNQTTIYSLKKNKFLRYLNDTTCCKISEDGAWIVTTNINQQKISLYSMSQDQVIIDINALPRFQYLSHTYFSKSDYCTMECRIGTNPSYPIINMKKGTLAFTVMINPSFSKICFKNKYLAVSNMNKLYLIHKKYLPLLEEKTDIPNNVYTIQELLELVPVLEFCNNRTNTKKSPEDIKNHATPPIFLFLHDGKHIITIDSNQVLRIVHIKSGATVFSQEHVAHTALLNETSLIDETSLQITFLGEESNYTEESYYFIKDIIPKTSLSFS